MAKILPKADSEDLEGTLSITEIAPRIVGEEKVRFGRPVIQGPRAPLNLVVGKLAGGMSIEETGEEYELEREDVGDLGFRTSPDEDIFPYAVLSSLVETSDSAISSVPLQNLTRELSSFDFLMRCRLANPMMRSSGLCKV